ncbi:MAG: hypothetical protein HYR94_16330, partial [Chloroflexi bacterium]|nr:hypothetical protein [Chloroflexota bacterium]
LFGAVGIALLARKWAGVVAGVAAAALTLFSPVLVEPSLAILAEFPSVAWSVWAIWLAWLASDEPANTPTSSAQPPSGTGQRSGESALKRRTLLILSGLCLSASLMTKLLSPFVAILIPVILVIRWYQFRISDSISRPTLHVSRFTLHALRFTLHAPRFKPLLTDLFIWSLAVLLPALILMSAFNIEALVRQVIEQRLGARAAATEAEPFWPPRYERGAMFVQEDTALVILGLLGLGLAWLRRQQSWWLLLAWLILALGMLALHNPIRYKHYLILIPPLAILGGFAITQWIYDLRFTIYDLMSQSKSPISNTQWAHRLQSQIITLAGLILLIGLYAWQIPATLALWQAKAAVPQPPPDEVEALAFIESVTAPGDCLISDDTPLLYWSGRMAPPELAEVSTNRLESGALTTAELMVISDQYDCQLVAAVSNRIAKYLPDYMDWVKGKYLGRFHYGQDDLYFAKIDTDPQPASPLWADFSGQIIFHGYALSHGSEGASPGDRVPLTLTWQAQTRLDTDYAIFVQLRDAANTTLASADHQPYQGLIPTSTWPAGSVIQEVTWLQLPPDIPPGSYNIYAGLYRPDNLERLPLQGDTSGENALILGPLVVQ